jgi:small subunit ribosomal protein S11
MKKKKKVTKKSERKIEKGRIYIQATFNNTLITITDMQGNSICWGSTGAVGFKNARKSTPFAANTAIDDVIKRGREKGLSEVDVYIKGPGPGRGAALRSLQAAGLKISSISDVTPIPHNGVRPPKKRRV